MNSDSEKSLHSLVEIRKGSSPVLRFMESRGVWTNCKHGNGHATPKNIQTEGKCCLERKFDSSTGVPGKNRAKAADNPNSIGTRIQTKNHTNSCTLALHWAIRDKKGS